MTPGHVGALATERTMRLRLKCGQNQIVFTFVRLFMKYERSLMAHSIWSSRRDYEAGLESSHKHCSLVAFINVVRILTQVLSETREVAASCMRRLSPIT